MNADRLPVRRSDPRRRLIALALLLVLSLGMAAALAFQAIQTARRYRQTAERALHDYADFGAFILASRVYRDLGAAVVTTFSGSGSWLGTAPVVPPGTACPGGVTWLERPMQGTTLNTAGAPLAAAEATFLADTLRNASPLLGETGWRFRWIRLPPLAAVEGVFIASHMDGPGRYTLRGFTACLGGGDSPFRRVMLNERALPPSIIGDLPADSLYSVVATGHYSGPLFSSPRQYASPYRGTARLGTEFGDLSVQLSLRPDVAGRLVIGGVPASPTPLALGLLAVSTLLVVTALLQLRREYELIAIRSDFISSVSHELRTPLSQMLIFAELLKLGRLRDDAERQRAMDIVDQEVRRLIRLVENVLQFSRAEAGRKVASAQDVRLPEVVRETIEAFRPLAAARGATVRLEAPAEAEVRGDAGAIRQILLNLLDNALKYGPKDQAVQVVIGAHGGHTRLSVEDQGPGIPLTAREQVWEGFYRLERERDSGVAGSGIGLAVVRALAEDMGGRAWVEDASTGGARFVIELASANGAEP